MKIDKRELRKRESLLIGQTLQTKDKYLPHNEKTTHKLKASRPVIIVDKLTNRKGKEEYAVVPTSTQVNSKHTSPYGKYGIKRYRHNLEVRDVDGQPIQQNEKFKKTKNCTNIPVKDAQQMRDDILKHGIFSSENRKKYKEFKSREIKKSKN